MKQEAGRKGLGDLAPKFAELNDDVLFGEVWSRVDKLSLRDRCMITIVALVSKGIFDNSLKYHIANAKAHGVTKEEMVEIITHIAFYVGWPNAWAVFPYVREVYQDEKITKEPLFGLGKPNDAKGGGQILLCTDGEGYYQEEGKEVRKLHPGEVVYIAPNLKHWHGASKDSYFTHLAIEVPGENTHTEWLEPVSEEEYSKLD